MNKHIKKIVKFFKRNGGANEVDNINEALKHVGFLPDPGIVIAKSKQGICAHCSRSLPETNKCPRNWNAEKTLYDEGVNSVRKGKQKVPVKVSVRNCPHCNKPVIVQVISVEPLGGIPGFKKVGN